MTTIHQSIKRDSLKKEVMRIKESAHSAALSKESARRFLVSTGVYTSKGKLKASFR